MADRPSVDQYFMDMTQLVKARGTCPRRQVGAVVVKDKRVLTTGYNGAPRNFPHPVDTGCLRDELGIPRGMLADVCPCLHAEQNAILQAATTGVSIEGADLYCTTQPCTQCSRMVANAGIRRVCFVEEYPDPLAVGILTTAGVELWIWDPVEHTMRLYGPTNTFEEAQDALRTKWREGAMDLVPRSPLAPAPTESGPALGPGQPGGPDGSADIGGPVAGGGPQEPTEGGPAAGTTAGAETGTAEGAGDDEAAVAAGKVRMRDLRDDPGREAIIRRLAREKADRIRKAREDAGLGR